MLKRSFLNLNNDKNKRKIKNKLTLSTGYYNNYILFFKFFYLIIIK